MPHLVDITMFHAPEGGGVKRYLKAKHRWLQERPHWRHSLLVPGGRGARNEPGHISIPSPRIPFANGYRFPIENWRWRQALENLEPDIIEAGDPYQLAWTTQLVAQDLGIRTVGFHHSDLARM